MRRTNAHAKTMAHGTWPINVDCLAEIFVRSQLGTLDIAKGNNTQAIYDMNTSREVGQPKSNCCNRYKGCWKALQEHSLAFLDVACSDVMEALPTLRLEMFNANLRISVERFVMVLTTLHMAGAAERKIRFVITAGSS